MVLENVCSSCGSRVEDTGFREYQESRVDDFPPMCRGCVEQIKTNAHIQSAFDAISDGLSPENRREFESSAFKDKFWFFLSQNQKGNIRPGDSDPLAVGSGGDFGSQATRHLVEAYLARLEYDDEV